MAGDDLSDDYLSLVAHDLRGSLNGIIGWAELVRRKALPPEGNVRAGETIIRQAKRQLDLINEAVDAWRLLSGNLRLQLVPLDAKELVTNAVNAAREDSRKAVTFNLHLKALPAPLCADGDRLLHVLIGLFSRAIHFSPEHGTIDVTLKPGRKNSAEFSVHDSGAGIDPAALPYLFSRQRPQDPARNSPRARFGRGLGLIHDIIDLHGGTIEAETDGGSGVTFCIRLPLAKAPVASVTT
jgi:two-component system, chemotaxis family, CheB/CheR fusion protein